MLLTATLFSILKILSEHTSYLSHQYNTVIYQHFLNKDVCIHSEYRIRLNQCRPPSLHLLDPFGGEFGEFWRCLSYLDPFHVYLDPFMFT